MEATKRVTAGKRVMAPPVSREPRGTPDSLRVDLREAAERIRDRREDVVDRDTSRLHREIRDESDETDEQCVLQQVLTCVVANERANPSHPIHVVPPARPSD